MSTVFTSRSPWATLPAEMKFSVLDQLDIDDVRAFSKVSREAYGLSIPTLFRSVHIANAEALRCYVAAVPPSYNHHVRRLTICTKSPSKRAPSTADASISVTDALVQLLPHCSQVEHLTLSLAASLAKHVIPCFQLLHSLRALSVNHCGDEGRHPLSERLIVAIAASIPSLTQLSLDRIARSVLHAPELLGVRPYVPLVRGDEDIPDHPLLGAELRLPSLLRLPTLKRLRIRDTHLGDAHWATTPVYCSLEVLDLGSCYHESHEFNRICTERIMGNVGHTVDECALNTGLTSQAFANANSAKTPLQKLRKVHLTPLFPVENVVNTLTTLSDSPVESLSVQCHEDDVVDMCSALESFLNLRTERGGKGFFKHLNELLVSTVSDINDAHDITVGTKKPQNEPLSGENADAVRRLQEYCRDLRLSGAGNSDSTGATPSKTDVPDVASEKVAAQGAVETTTTTTEEGTTV